MSNKSCQDMKDIAKKIEEDVRCLSTDYNYIAILAKQYLIAHEHCKRPFWKIKAYI